MLNRVPASVNRNKIWFVGYQVSPADRYSWQESGGNWIIGRDEVVQELLYDKMKYAKENKHSETIVISRTSKNSSIYKTRTGSAQNALWRSHSRVQVLSQ